MWKWDLSALLAVLCLSLYLLGGAKNDTPLLLAALLFSGVLLVGHSQGYRPKRPLSTQPEDLPYRTLGRVTTTPIIPSPRLDVRVFWEGLVIFLGYAASAGVLITSFQATPLVSILVSLGFGLIGLLWSIKTFRLPDLRPKIHKWLVSVGFLDGIHRPDFRTALGRFVVSMTPGATLLTALLLGILLGFILPPRSTKYIPRLLAPTQVIIIYQLPDQQPTILYQP